VRRTSRIDRQIANLAAVRRNVRDVLEDCDAGRCRFAEVPSRA
jgi:hypothetical protein